MMNWFVFQAALRDYVLGTLPKHIQDSFDSKDNLIIKFYNDSISKEGLIKVSIGDENAD